MAYKVHIMVTTSLFFALNSDEYFYVETLVAEGDLEGRMSE